MVRESWPVVVALMFLTACGSTASSSAPDDARSQPTAATSSDGAQLLRQVSSRSFQVSYEVRDTKIETSRIIVASAPPAFSWREDDAVNGGEPTLARHLVQVDADTVVGCIWVGADIAEPADWECARSPVAGEGGLFGEFFGGLLFGVAEFDADRVTDWDTTQQSKVLDREVVCGTSSGFSPEVTEVCLDSDTGVPLSLHRGTTVYTATAFGAPRPDAFTPPRDA